MIRNIARYLAKMFERKSDPRVGNVVKLTTDIDVRFGGGS